MSLKYHTGSAWADLNKLKYHNGSAWVSPSGKHYHNGSAWISLLTAPPANMIILYDSTTIPSGYLANGSNGTTNLLDRFVYGSTAFGTSGGYSTHSGADHGAASATTSSYSHPSGSPWPTKNGSDRSNMIASSHTHTIASHSHAGSVNNIDLISYKKLVPSMLGAYIGQNAVFLKASSLSQADWSALVSAAYYLYLTNAVGNIAGTSHAHTSYTMNTSTYTPTLNTERSDLSTSNWPSSHYHTANHSLSTSGEQTPTYQQLLAYKYTGTTPLGMESIPIGSIAIFTSATLPSGWSRYTPSDSKLIRMGTSATSGGSTTHTHSSSSITTGGRTGTNNMINEGYSSGRYISTHTHTFTDDHTAGGNIIPAYTTFVLGYRAS